MNLARAVEVAECVRKFGHIVNVVRVKDTQAYEVVCEDVKLL